MKRLGVVLVLGALAAGVGLPWLGERDFWPPDEARYGEVAREMAEGKHAPLIPHLNGVVYPDKPPGFFWAVVASGWVTGGVDETAARLPSVIAAVALVVLVGLWVASSAGAGTGVLAGLMLLGTLLFSYQMRQAQIDMLFAVLIAGSMAAFFRTWNGGSRWWCTLAGVLTLLAIFVKGPLALLGVAVVVVWSLITKRPRAFFNAGTTVGLVVLLLGAAGWLFAAWTIREADGPGLGDRYLEDLGLRNVTERVDRGMAHEKDWDAYLRVLPGGLLPLFPVMLLLLFARVRRGVFEGSRPLLRFAFLWLVVFLVVQSALPGKRDIYLLPLYPAAAILLAFAADGAANAMPGALRAWSGIVAFVLLAASGLAIHAGFATGGFESIVAHARDLAGAGTIDRALARIGVSGVPDPALLRSLELWGILVLPLSAAAFSLTFAGARAPRASLGWTALATAVAVGACVGLVLPRFDAIGSRRAVAERLASIATAAGADTRIAMFNHLDEGIPFYFKNPVPEIPGKDPATRRRLSKDVPEERDQAREALRGFLKAPHAVAVVRGEDVLGFELEEGKDFKELGRATVRDKIFLIVGGAP